MTTTMFVLPDIDATYCVHEFKRPECALCTEPTPTIGVANRAAVERIASTGVAIRLITSVRRPCHLVPVPSTDVLILTPRSRWLPKRDGYAHWAPVPDDVA